MNLPAGYRVSTSYHSIGEGLEEHFGPIRRTLFCLETAFDLTMLESSSAETISLQIQTHHHPFGSTAREDRSVEPAQEMFQVLQKLFSSDSAIASAAVLRVLNSNLTHALTEQSGAFAEELKRVREITRQDKEPVRPELLFAVAGEFASQPFRTNHATYEDIFEAARTKLSDGSEIQKIIDASRILSLPNSEINVSQLGGVGSDIIISGKNIALAVDKLLAARMVFNPTWLNYFRADLQEWQDRHQSHPAVASIDAVMHVFDKYDLREGHENPVLIRRRAAQEAMCKRLAERQFADGRVFKGPSG